MEETDLDRYVNQPNKRGWIYIDDSYSNVLILWQRNSARFCAGNEGWTWQLTAKELFGMMRFLR